MHRWVSGSHARLAAAAVLAIAIAFPAGILAAHQFGDVTDGNQYHADIDALVDSGVTTGCGNNNYCPSSFVTREQMAAFLNRLGALSPSKTPVVNADRIDGLDSTAFLKSQDIVQTLKGPWALTKSWLGTATIDQYSDVTVVNGSTQTAVNAPVTAIASIGGQEYGLSAVEFCFVDAQSTNASLWVLTVTATSAFSSVPAFGDSTVRAVGANACHTISGGPVAAGSGIFLGIGAQFAGSGSLGIGTTTLTWSPLP